MKQKSVDWSQVPIDTKLELRVNDKGFVRYDIGYFAGTTMRGKPTVWIGGRDSQGARMLNEKYKRLEVPEDILKIL